MPHRSLREYRNTSAEPLGTHLSSAPASSARQPEPRVPSSPSSVSILRGPQVDVFVYFLPPRPSDHLVSFRSLTSRQVYTSSIQRHDLTQGVTSPPLLARLSQSVSQSRILMRLIIQRVGLQGLNLARASPSPCSHSRRQRSGPRRARKGRAAASQVKCPSRPLGRLVITARQNRGSNSSWATPGWYQESFQTTRPFDSDRPFSLLHPCGRPHEHAHSRFPREPRRSRRCRTTLPPPRTITLHIDARDFVCKSFERALVEHSTLVTAPG